VLAYVFWHWTEVDLDLDSYVKNLKKFHDSLRNNKPQGLQEVAVFYVEDLPWLGAKGGFEDWYTLTGSADLDVLNDAAISQIHQTAHDQIARLASGGTAGLYRLRKGTPRLDFARYATWFHKPSGVSYPELFDLIAPLVENQRATLWGRQLTLGPTPEFCLHSTEELSLPGSLNGMKVNLKRI
jgi:hypothetical protein